MKNKSRYFFASFLFITSLSISTAFSLELQSDQQKASYKVPMPLKYKKVSEFKLENFKITEKMDLTTFSFFLPIEIIGYKNYRIELSGPTKISGVATFTGKKADALCKKSIYGKMTCNVRYKSIDINMNRIQSALEKTYGSTPTFSDRMDVALSFIKEPIGIITYDIN